MRSEEKRREGGPHVGRVLGKKVVNLHVLIGIIQFFLLDAISRFIASLIVSIIYKQHL